MKVEEKLAKLGLDVPNLEDRPGTLARLTAASAERVDDPGAGAADGSVSAPVGPARSCGVSTPRSFGVSRAPSPTRLVCLHVSLRPG